MTKNIFILLLLISSPVWSLDDRGEVDAVIDEVLDVTGATDEIAQLPAILDAVYGPLKKSVSTTNYSKITTIFKEAFAEGKFLEYWKEQFRENYDDKLCKSIIEVHKKDSFRRVIRAQIDYIPKINAPQSSIEDYASPSSDRDSIYENLFKAEKSKEHGIELSRIVVESIFSTFNLVVRPSKRVQKDVIDSLIEKQVTQILSPEYLRSEKKIYQVKYANVSNEDLIEYLSFLNSTAGEYLDKVVFEGFIRAAMACMRVAVNRIGTEIDLADNA